MKNFFLLLFVLILLNGESLTNSISKNKPILKKRQNDSSISNSKSDESQITIYLQKVYSGNDPYKIINQSEQIFNKYSITINQQLLVFNTVSRNGETGEIYDTIFLKDLYTNNDNAEKSECCVKTKFQRYEPCNGDCQNTGVEGFEANNCIELDLNDYIWRMCSENRKQITILYNDIKQKIIENNLPQGKKLDLETWKKNSVEDEYLIRNWDWHNQLKWGPQCENSIYNLQSPVILDNPQESQFYSNENIEIDYFFKSCKYEVVKNGKEIIVMFPDYCGLFRLKAGSQSLIYQPQYMSFRFNSEHVISTKRFDGEILIHLTEVNSDKKSWITRGLVISIFLESQEKSKSLSYLENLNMDFWKLELLEKKKPKYSPGKEFNLELLISDCLHRQPKYFLYKGSHTTPNCDSNVFHLVFDKPLFIPEIQFSLLREKSLIDLKEKEIHARIAQSLLSRKVIKNSCSSIAFNKKLDSFLESYLTGPYMKTAILTNNIVNGDDSTAQISRTSIRDAGIKLNFELK